MSRGDRIRQKKETKRKRKISGASGGTLRGVSAAELQGTIAGLDYAPAAHKLSTILTDYASPLLAYASDAQQAALMLHAAARYWNWSFLSDDAWRKKLDAALTDVPLDERTLALRDVPMMIDRRRTLYPQEHRRMDKVSVEVEGENLRVHVAQLLT